MYRNLKNNQNKDICNKCTSCCCNHIPGAWAPQEVTAKSLIDLIKEKKVTIWDYYGIPIPRPANFEDEKYKPLVKFVQIGKCYFLSSDGCMLPWKEKPYECKGLNPREGGHCSSKPGTNILSISYLWDRNNPIMTEVIKTLKLKELYEYLE